MSDLMERVERSCRQVQVPVAVAAPVTVQRSEQPSLHIGERVFELAPRLDVAVDELAAGQTVEQLLEHRRRLQQRSEQAGAVAVAYEDVSVLEQASERARVQADDAVDSAQKATARHQVTQEQARECVLVLSDRVQVWATGGEGEVSYSAPGRRADR